MPTDILISSDPWENRVAILEDGSLSEIYFEREEKVIGSIYKGKVQNVLPGMGASFVDIGLGRNAFLYVDDINRAPLNIGDVEITQGRSGWTISEKVNRGDDVLAQIVKEPRGLKGARISTNISLPGRYLVLMPTGKYSGVSRKIETEERNRLKSVMKRIRPEGMATVVRTAASGVSEAELIADLGLLIRMWHGILEMYKRAPSPSLMHKDMNLVYKAARDFITSDVERVLIDDAAEFEKVRDFMRLLGPQYLDRIRFYEQGKALFKDFKIDEELQKLLRPKINLPSGGSIVIETTEALTVIDVNSGKFTGGKNLEDTIVRTNVEAAAEIARQVRLRDIGGIIVCDFIDMNQESSRNRVIATLESVLRKDRTRTTIQSFSALGLLEFTRKRVGKDLSAQLRGACPTCSGLGSVMSPESVAIETFRRIRHSANGHHEPIAIEAAPTVAAQIEYWYEEERKALEAELATPIAVRIDAFSHPEKTRIKAGEPATGDPPPVRVGDEHEVDLLNVRLPNPTSALAVVNGRLVEVENAAAAIGQTIKIRILDVDDGAVMAEARTPVLAAGAEGKRKRRRSGRGRGRTLTPAEQAQELRELAEEAAQASGGRTAPIGISTAFEAEPEEAVALQSGAASEPAPEPERDAARVDPRADGPADENGEVRRRRRRRRRRHGAAPGGELSAFGIPSESMVAQIAAEPIPAAPFPSVSEGAVGPPAAEEDGLRRRRRRRRRRGRGGAGGTMGAPESAVAAAPPPAAPIVPERHIFRVAADGAAEPTGQTAPREPSRAIAPWNRRVVAPAVEPPPPHLVLEREPPAKVTKPTRRPRRSESQPAVSLAAATSLQALPSAFVAPEVVAEAPEEPAPKRRTRKAADTGEAPKRTRKKVSESADSEPGAESQATASRKKAPANAAKSTTKRSARRPSPASRKKA